MRSLLLIDDTARLRRSAEAYSVIMKSGLVQARCREVYDIHFRKGPMGKREMYEFYLNDHLLTNTND